MKRRSSNDPIATFEKPTDDWEKWREGIIGFGERSSRKTYYAELQRQMEELERFKALLDQSHDAIFLIDASSGRLTDANATAFQLLGYTKEEVLRMSVAEVTDDQIAGKLRTIYTEKGSSPEAQDTLITYLRTREAAKIPVEMSVRVVEFDNTSYIVSVARDITERMRLQQERELILTNVPVGIAFTRDRIFIWINEGLQDLFGYSQEELQGQTTEILYGSRAEYEELGQDAYPAIASGESYIQELLMKRKDGQMFWCQLSGKAANPDDLSQGAIWILEDISERKQIEEARQRLNEELEQRVAVRTAELAQANEEIHVLNEQLKDENMQMRTEMDLARRIQTSLLPELQQEHHPDFEIAAVMLPADEVGGDYYDIALDLEGNLWFGIGDVSGHGVTPGLIMMMAQTAHTTITANYHCSPRDIVIMVNKVLYKNVHERLGEDHFMTFTALKYLGEGRFQHAGAHMDIVVYRQKCQGCERIDTPGAWLNFVPDISHGIKNSEFTLDIGDVLVLYTDGLTEVWNREGNMLDIHGFMEIVNAHAHKDVDTLRGAIITDVMTWCNHIRNDDMSLVVARRIN